MSTNSNCLIVEVRRGAWYYVLEDYNAPKNAWDWLDHATAYGPFSDKTAALDHLDRNHPNPGGYSTQALPDGVDALDFTRGRDLTLKARIDEARAPAPPRTGRRWPY